MAALHTGPLTDKHITTRKPRLPASMTMPAPCCQPGLALSLDQKLTMAGQGNCWGGWAVVHSAAVGKGYEPPCTGGVTGCVGPAVLPPVLPVAEKL